ncbi:hypothetical protein MMC06_002555, partial [Schaereria dolodes]|nr:hypothetical protein [Schaereria dolodes]
MASEPLEKRHKNPTQSSNARQSTAVSDTPLFTSRRPPPRTQQREFFTDSTNTSYIPTPSPTKTTKSAFTPTAAGARPRQARSHGKSLAAAFKATAAATDKDRLHSLPSPDRRETKSALKARSIPAHVPVPQHKPLKSLPQDRSRTRTPSPARIRKDLILSPSSSASSPPRGLAEAYQRIEDEEFLAGQEDDSLDEVAQDSPLYKQRESSQDRNSIRLQESSDSASPVSLKTSRRSSQSALGEQMPQRDDSTQRSDEGSQASLPSNATDDTFNRALLQYAKDEHRLKSVLKSDAGQFRKAHLGERVGLTAENLDKKNGSNHSGSSTLGSGSISSMASDMGPNIPAEWGRRGKTRRDWLSRINSRSGRFTGDVPKTQKIEVEKPTPEGLTHSEPLVDWIAAASDIPLPSLEDSSPKAASTSKNSAPFSMAGRNPSIDKLRDWEIDEDDFTARSLQISDSPPIKIKNTALDRIREREIENLEKSAVTTSRLGELREKRSLEHITRRSPSVAAIIALQEEQEEDEAFQDIQDTPTEALQNALVEEDSEGEGREDATPEAPNSNSETPVIVYRSRPEGTNGKSIADRKKAFPRTEASSRPNHERHDSRDLLRRLARVTSASPSPSPTKGTWASGKPTYEGNAEKSTSKPMLQGQNRELVTVSEGPDLGGEEDQAAKNIEGIAKPNMASTPQPKSQNTYLKTPLVTGAWISTPLPTGGRGIPMPTPEEIEEERDMSINVDDELVELGARDLMRNLGLGAAKNPSNDRDLAETAPSLPKSALAAILDNAKQNMTHSDRSTHPSRQEIHDNNKNNQEADDTLNLDDSTIQSLENLIVNDTDLNLLLDESPQNPQDTRETSPSPTGPQTITQQQELSSYTHLRGRLSRLSLSIRDAKNGIASLERAVSSTTTTSKSKPNSTTALIPSVRTNKDLSSSSSPVTSECTEAGEFHDFIWPCEVCGCRGGGQFGGQGGRVKAAKEEEEESTWQWQTVRLPVPRLWTWRTGDHWRPRLTWLGVLTTVAWGLLLGELVA